MKQLLNNWKGIKGAEWLMSALAFLTAAGHVAAEVFKII